MLAVPAGRVAQDPGDEVAHVLDAHAARRIEAHQLAEQALLRRVVHVDAVRAREVDLDRGHGVAGARILAEAVLRGVVGRPVDRRRIDLAAVRREDADVVLEIVGSFRISGMMSLRTIDSGAFQYGLTMISLILELTIGVWRSILPTIAV